MSRWFRVYDDMIDDPKVQKLPDNMFKALVNLWCLASKNDGYLPPMDEVVFKLRMRADKVEKIIAHLMACGLLDGGDQNDIRPHNWDGRQFLSDSSNIRVKRHREKRAAAGLASQWAASKSLRAAIYSRDSYACVYCGATEDLTLDHKTPEGRGGSHEQDNLQTACRQCNAAKRDLTHEEYVSRNADVTLQKRPQTTDYREQKDPEPRGSAPSASSDLFAGEVEIINEDPNAKLFREGLVLLESFGVPEKRARPLLGQWKKSCHDPTGLLAAIRFARQENVIEPIAYISKVISQGRSNGRQQTSGGDLARELADEARRLEAEKGIARPFATV